MDNNHQNPIVSTVFGVVGGMLAYSPSFNFDISSFFEVFKVIVYAFIGGLAGQLGRNVLIYIADYLKKKSKDACK